jgi:hypothetical protein
MVSFGCEDDVKMGWRYRYIYDDEGRYRVWGGVSPS